MHRQKRGGGPKGPSSQDGRRKKKDGFATKKKATPEERKAKNMQFMQKCAAQAHQSFSAPGGGGGGPSQNKPAHCGGTFAKKAPAAKTDLSPKEFVRAALDDPPTCTCWTDDTFNPLWTEPDRWGGEMFRGIRETAAMNGAALLMCCKPESEMGPREHRKLHISLNNGEIRIDLPLLETVDGVETPLFTVHSYCTAHRRFEGRSVHYQKPPSPILWTSCIKD